MKLKIRLKKVHNKLSLGRWETLTGQCCHLEGITQRSSDRCVWNPGWTRQIE
jgi:hypothetical protein